MNSVLLVGENQVSDAARHFKHPAANSEAAACQDLQLVIEDLIERFKIESDTKERRLLANEDLPDKIEELIQDEEYKESHVIHLSHKLPRQKEIFERDQLRITLKIFPANFEQDDLEECVNAALQHLHTDHVDVLYLAVPANAVEDLGLCSKRDLKEENVDEKYENLLKLWKKVEQLIDSGLVMTAGIADLNPAAFIHLCENACHKPKYFQINVDLCEDEKVPDKLLEFANKNDIHLKADFDPKELLSDKSLNEMFPIINKESCKVSLGWVLRILSHVKEREILTENRYLAKLILNEKN